MEAALLHDERTDCVSTNTLRHDWAYQKLANQQAIFRGGGCKYDCDLGYDWLTAETDSRMLQGRPPIDLRK